MNNSNTSTTQSPNNYCVLFQPYHLGNLYVHQTEDNIPLAIEEDWEVVQTGLTFVEAKKLRNELWDGLITVEEYTRMAG